MAKAMAVMALALTLSSLLLVNMVSAGGPIIKVPPKSPALNVIPTKFPPSLPLHDFKARSPPFGKGVPNNN